MIEKKPGAGGAEAIESIRAGLHKKIKADIHNGRLTATGRGVSPVDNKELEQLLKSVVEAHKLVGTVNPRPPGMINGLIQALKKLLRRILRWHTHPIIEFQLSTVRFLQKIMEILSSRQARIAELERKVESLSASLMVLHRQMEQKNFEGDGESPGINKNYFIGGKN